MKPNRLLPLTTLAAAAICLSSPHATAALGDGLVGYWPFDADLLDASGNGADGTFNPGTFVPEPAPSFVPGVFDNGIDLNNFDAGNFEQSVEITGVPENTFDFTGGSMSFSLWTQTLFLTLADQTILAKGEGTSWSFAANGIEIAPAFKAGVATITGDSALHPLDDGFFHHYVGVAEAGVGLKLYRDGELIASLDGSPAIGDSPVNLLIGGNPQGTGANGKREWEGIIDDVGIWNRALTPSEVNLLWNSGAGVAIGVAINPADTDGDGMPDFYETTNGLNPNNPDDADQGADDGLFDNDGLTNLEEFILGTDPNNPDTDGDGLNDGPEVSGALNPFGSAPTLPLNPDSDGDSLSDGEEVNGTLNGNFGNAPTDPNDPDTDGDGATDAQEIAFGFDPNDPASSPTPFQRGLKAFWGFDQNLLDGSGQGFDGVMLGTNPTARFTTGKLGRAILLDGRTGVNQSVQISNSGSAFDAPGGSVTISAWLRLSSAATPEPHILGKGAGSNYRLTMAMASSQLIYHGGAPPISGGGSIAGPVWRHVVAVSEAGVGTRLYLDGLLVAVGAAPALGSNSLPLEIGGNPEIFDRNWNGLLDEVSVWCRALTTGEVRQLWNDGAGAPMADLVVGTDTDGDGMSDLYETAHGLNPNLDDAALDLDGDGLTNLEEHDAGSDPGNADTDGDGLDDGDEATAGTNPLTPDTDGDGLTDGEEVSGSQNPFLNGTLRDPFDPSADPAGDPTNPLEPDTDGDSWSDRGEIQCLTDPNDAADFCPFPVVIAYWDFDAPFNAVAPQVPVTQTTSTQPGLLDLTLRANAAQTPDAGGRSGKPGDRGLDLGSFNDMSSAKTRIGAHFDEISASSTYTVTFWQFNRQVASISAFWMNAPAATGTQRGIQAHTPWNNGTIYFDQSGCCEPPQRLTVTGPAILNQWQHFAFVRDPVANKRSIYVDGREVASADAGEVLDPLNGILTIGADLNDGNSFNGIIDEFAIFGVALAPEDVAALADGSINPLGGSGNNTPPADVRITSLGFNGVPLEVSVEGLDATDSYILRRSQDGQNFTEVGSSFTGAATHVFIDPSPPAGLALYQIWTTD